MVQQSDGELAPMILQAHERLAAGDRQGALEDARLAVERFPRVADSHRCLSSILTHNDLFRYDKRLCRALVDDGAIAEALKHTRNAMRLADRDYQDFLQAGYCLTVLGRIDEATEQIRRATDISCAASKPGLFANMDDTWKPLVPRFLIVGVKKGGTTSLYNYLSRHPRVLAPVMKEIQFFGYPQRSLNWYFAHFPRRPQWEKRFISGEARVDNFTESGIPEGVRGVLPSSRLVVVLRDPVERAISHYYHDRKVGAETRTLEVAFEEELDALSGTVEEMEAKLASYLHTQRRYLYYGLYERHVSKWLSLFPPEQFLIVISEELNADPDREIRRVFKHVGLEYHRLGDYVNALPGTYDGQSRDGIRAKLVEFYARPNQLLYQLLRRRLDWQG